jgi:hypothetical protein
MKKTFKNTIPKLFNINMGLFKYGTSNWNCTTDITVKSICRHKIKDTLNTSIDIDDFLEVYYFNFHKEIYCDSISTVAHKIKKKTLKYLDRW